MCYSDPQRIRFMVSLSGSGSGQIIRIRPDPDPQHFWYVCNMQIAYAYNMIVMYVLCMAEWALNRLSWRLNGFLVFITGGLMCT